MSPRLQACLGRRFPSNFRRRWLRWSTRMSNEARCGRAWLRNRLSFPTPRAQGCNLLHTLPANCAVLRYNHVWLLFLLLYKSAIVWLSEGELLLLVVPLILGGISQPA